MRSGCVYSITNTTNGDRYVGSSVSVNRRRQAHFRLLRSGDHENERLQRAWRKYGENAFSFSILEEVSATDLIAREQAHIDHPSSVYNLNKEAGFPPSLRGCVRSHSEATRKKISASKTGKKNPHGEPRVQLKCIVCPNLFKTRAVNARSGRAKFCSRRCMGLYSADKWFAKVGRLRKGTKLSKIHKKKISAGLRRNYQRGNECAF